MATVARSDGELHRGVVCSLKDHYGFIDREDMVREIFFHFTEVKGGDVDELSVGDHVQFYIQQRHNKDVGVGVTLLAPGSVVFEDINPKLYSGIVHKQQARLPIGRRHSESTASQPAMRIVYKTETGEEEEILFNERVTSTEFSLFNGDQVEFCLSTDRRDKSVKPANIRLLTQQSFQQSNEIREKGYITTLKEGFGFIRCTDREARMFFHFKEKLDPSHDLDLQQEVEFTVIEDPSNPSRLIAVRISALQRGTIQLSSNTLLQDKLIGSVEKEAGTQTNADSDPGIIMYDVCGTKQTIPYSSSVVDGELPRLRDKVEFQISESQKNNIKTAMNVKVSSRATVPREQGQVVTLKDTFGFIELSDHQHEVFFHYSSYDGVVEELDLGDEVEFTLSHKSSSRQSAENIRKLSANHTPRNDNEVIQPAVLEGRVVRGVRVSNPDQSEYCGLIQVTDIEAIEVAYLFSIGSLVDKRDLPQKGEAVRFQVAESSPVGKNSSGKMTRAVCVAPLRRYVHHKIASVQEDGIAYLDYEVEESRRLSFPLSQLQDCPSVSASKGECQVAGGQQAALVEGDEVELVIVHSLRGAWSVHNVRKIYDKPRPERLISRLKSVTDDSQPRVVTSRQPRGPDGSTGFHTPRSHWSPRLSVTAEIANLSDCEEWPNVELTNEVTEQSQTTLANVFD